MKEKVEVNSWNNYMYSPLPHIHTSGGGGGGLIRLTSFMSINKNNNKRKRIKNKGVYLYTLLICHLLVIIDYETGYQIKA